MQAVQFFLFGIIIVWLVGSGKLAAFVNALRGPSGSGGGAGGGTPAPVGGWHPLINGQEPTLDGKTNAVSGAQLDPQYPVLRVGPLAGGEFT
jgi:hypothetical protein